jgi:predicted Zn-dependent protease
MRRLLTVFLSLILALQGVTAARAQDALNIVRDAEIEDDLHYMIRPIFLAANLKPEDITLVVIESEDINAFVAGGMNMFLYTALILATDTPQQLIGVMAHETGHIAGGHLARRGEGEENASILAILGTVVGVAAAVGAQGSGAGGALAAGQGMGLQSILAFTRTQEASADQAGVRFLETAGMSPYGMYQFLAKLMGQEAMPENREVEYTRTHPLTEDRVSAIKYAADQWAAAHGGRVENPAPPEVQLRYDRMKAKLLGYLQPAVALRRFGKNATDTTSRYGRAFALYRSNQTQPALALMDQLIAAEPENPYFYEFKGQMLFESGKGAEAVAPYQQAVKYAPNSGLIKVEAAHALLETENPAYTDEAIADLSAALPDEHRDPFIHHLLAMGYGRKGQMGRVHLELAQEAQLSGDDKLAKREANLAMGISPVGSRDYLAAQDLLSSIKPIKGSKEDREDKDK